MKYTDISKQKKLSEKNSKNSKSKGVAKLFILFAVIISAGILFYFFCTANNGYGTKLLFYSVLEKKEKDPNCDNYGE